METRRLEEIFINAAMGREKRVRILYRQDPKEDHLPMKQVEMEETYPGPNLTALKWVLEQRAKSAPTGIEPLPFAAWSEEELVAMLAEGSAQEPASG